MAAARSKESAACWRLLRCNKNMDALRPSNPRWTDIEALRITAPARIGGGNCDVFFMTQAGEIHINFYSFGLRIRAGEALRDYGIIIDDPPALPVAAEELEGKTVLNCDAFTAHIYHEPFHFELYKDGKLVQRSPSDGHFVRQHRLPPLARAEKGWFFGLALASGEPLYGMGEKWGGLNKRGQLVRSHNHDALGVNAEISYKNTPFAWSPEGWGVLVHTPFSVTHGAGYAQWSNRSYNIFIENGPLDLFIFSGADGAEIIRHYTALTGRSSVPPEWSLGVILSRAYYRTADEILEAARQVREKGMPCEVITFDGRAWQDTRTRFAFEWDSSRYPDPKKIIDELKAMDFKICVWEYPLVSVENKLFAEMEQKGWLLKDKTGAAYRYEWDLSPFGKVLTPLPQSGIVDFTHPDAYAFWRDKHKDLFEIGVDMIKADFGEQVTDDMTAHNGACGAELHNVYSFLYNKCVHEAAEKFCESGAFLFSRAGWSGSQRFPSLWGGDPQADWEGLAASLRGGLSWGMSGGPYYATDIGGFYGDTRDETLYVRWLQAAIFSAHIRFHGIGPREPWTYGPEAEKAVNKALQIREELRPYLYDAVKEAGRTGMAVQRAMALAFPDQPELWPYENQFLCGPDIFVAPCLRPDGRVSFMLPRGKWESLSGDKTLEGGKRHEIILGLEEIAAFRLSA